MHIFGAARQQYTTCGILDDGYIDVDRWQKLNLLKIGILLVCSWLKPLLRLYPVA